MGGGTSCVYVLFGLANRIESVLIAFADIHERNQDEEALQNARNFIANDPGCGD